MAWFLWLVPFGFGSFDLFASDPSPWLGPFALAPFAHSTQEEGSRVEGEREREREREQREGGVGRGGREHRGEGSIGGKGA